MNNEWWDEDAMLAAVDLVHRSGASNFEFGYLEEDVPIDQARWWAKAQYRGAVLSVDEHRDPVAAAEALARRVLRGAKCVGCNRTVSLSGIVHNGRTCRWTREGRHWMAGCPAGRARLEERIAQKEQT